MTGILYILRAALLFLVCFFCAIYLMTEHLQTELSKVGQAGMPLYFLVVFIIWLAAAFDLTVGILGVLRAARPKRSAECLVLGVLTTIFEGFSLLPILVAVFLTVQGGTQIWEILGWAMLNVVIAVCYLVAAVQVRRSAQRPAATQWAYPMPPRY